MAPELVSSAPFGEFLLSEASGQRSRKNIVVAAGQKLASGAVVSALDTGGKIVAFGTALSSIAGILLGAVDATGTVDKRGVIIFQEAEVKKDSLVWAEDQDAAAQAAALAVLAAAPFNIQALPR